MAVTYDETVIIEFAERLYQRALFIMLAYPILGGVFGMLVVFGAGEYQGRSRNLSGIAVVVALVVAGIAFLVARERAFALRLQAQVALCQLQIERHTRFAATAAASAAMAVGQRAS